MIAIPGYRITSEVYSGSRTLVYRALAESDQTPVVIKLLKNEYPTFNELVPFSNQYTIAKNLNVPGIVKHLSRENYCNGFALVMEDNGGVSLSDYIATARQQNNSPFPVASANSSTLPSKLPKLWKASIRTGLFTKISNRTVF